MAGTCKTREKINFESGLLACRQTWTWNLCGVGLHFPTWVPCFGKWTRYQILNFIFGDKAKDTICGYLWVNTPATCFPKKPIKRTCVLIVLPNASKHPATSSNHSKPVYL